jgi:hypothetical protein
LQLKKQTEIQSAQQAAWEAKEQAEQLRKEMREMELAEVRQQQAVAVSKWHDAKPDGLRQLHQPKEVVLQLQCLPSTSLVWRN